MAKIHDKFIIELAEVIKGYSNDPYDEDPFRLSEFYRFYELPNIAVSRENFEKMRPIEPERKWIPVSERLPEKPNVYTVTDSKGDVVRFVFDDTESSREYWLRCAKAWMPLPEPWKGDKMDTNLRINCETNGFEEATEQIETLAEAYDGFPAQVTIKNCHHCTFNIYPSQTKFVDAEREINDER